MKSEYKLCHVDLFIGDNFVKPEFNLCVVDSVSDKKSSVTTRVAVMNHQLLEFVIYNSQFTTTFQISNITSMHSSRMRTTRLFPIPSMHRSWGGVFLGVGVFSWGWGVSSSGGGCIPACTEADTPPVKRITDACRNITLPQLRCGR